MRLLRIIPALLMIQLISAAMAADQQWLPLGPDGGTVRSLTLDPKNPDHIFLGTSAGTLYLSTDAGASWSRFARLGNSSEMVLDHVVIDPSDPRIMFVAAWNAQMPNSDGDLFRSKDAGKTWEIVADLHGKSLRALSMAASNPKILVVGALDGIYRSRDGGHAWERISPENHAEIKNIESIAIDPVNPEVIYAGTWHLPWKTEDGGKTWHSIKKGVIDDSDVFSIVIDQAQPANLFISACSGIYRSESAGELFRKIQGIPYSARRTRMLHMDPSDHGVVYAGTTEGLWKTMDSGATWKRMTGTNVIINDVLVDPRHPARVLLATDRGGVLASDDGGATFTPSNRGFTHRQAAALLVDRKDSSLIYAGLLSDKEFGGVFASADSGQSWKQMSEGLDGRDVFALRQAGDKTLIAGTDHGVYALKPGSSRWLALSGEPPSQAENSATKKKRAAITPVNEMSGRISSLEVSEDRWFAATNTGLFSSSNSGAGWRRETLPGVTGPVAGIGVSGKVVAVAGRNAVAVSVSGGQSWLPSKTLDADFLINSVAVDNTGDIWLAARSGLFRSTDAGDSWKRITTLRLADILTVQFDEENHRLLVISGTSTNVFESTDNGRTWNSINSGWRLRNLQVAHGRLMGTTSFDGVVIQPEVTASVDNVSGNGAR
ncbi:MAG TPA: transcriptional regulator [Candidatus Angelobacter sp.]|nr:transcriptional regulator [Candidatus Angelobacter sp.]